MTVAQTLEVTGITTLGITTLGNANAASFDSSSVYKVSRTQVVGGQQAAVADCSVSADGTSAGTKLNLLLAAMRAHGLIAT